MVNSNVRSGFVYNTQMNSGQENFLPIQVQQPKTCESGLTFNLPTNDIVVAPRKRSRDSFNDHFTPSNTSFSTPHKPCNGLSQTPSFVGDDVLPLVQQYQLDINSIISHHVSLRLIPNSLSGVVFYLPSQFYLLVVVYRRRK